MSHVTFKNIKGTDNILAVSISHLRSIHCYNSLGPEREGKEFEHDIFEELLPFIQNPSLR